MCLGVAKKAQGLHLTQMRQALYYPTAHRLDPIPLVVHETISFNTHPLPIRHNPAIPHSIQRFLTAATFTFKRAMVQIKMRNPPADSRAGSNAPGSPSSPLPTRPHSGDVNRAPKVNDCSLGGALMTPESKGLGTAWPRLPTPAHSGASVTPSSTPQNGAQQTGTAARRGLSPTPSDRPARRQCTGTGGLPPRFNPFQPLGGAPPVPDLPIDPIVLPPNNQYLASIGVPIIAQAQ
ncbi:hypothetical protein PtA15_12A376 [Puccinia triticina]|uniref:Uncharacterized protein n=1 Tax=Puccinia triticina TaxID=208348 RepID=A0ABY7D634_9BASI|nr:uncharacterized protein PtA15_12A376 [Puccinia triticina]WAQ90387.1 hypothetical protein PtA15_12A376 [Puccinia triticina]